MCALRNYEAASAAGWTCRSIWAPVFDRRETSGSIVKGFMKSSRRISPGWTGSSNFLVLLIHSFPSDNQLFPRRSNGHFATASRFAIDHWYGSNADPCDCRVALPVDYQPAMLEHGVRWPRATATIFAERLARKRGSVCNAESGKALRSP